MKRKTILGLLLCLLFVLGCGNGTIEGTWGRNYTHSLKLKCSEFDQNICNGKELCVWDEERSTCEGK